MALISCPECGKEISDKAVACPNCGCPIKVTETQIIVKASSDFIGLIGAYIIYDDKNNEVARLKAGEHFAAKLPDKKTICSVKLKGTFGAPKQMICEPHTVNRFSVSPSETHYGFVVSKVDVFDSRD